MKARHVCILCCAFLAACRQSEGTPAQPTGNDAALPESGEIGKLWVKTDRAIRRTFPSDKAPSVGMLFYREGATPIETKGGWTRVTKYYAAACENGQNRYVKRGDKACTAANGYRPDGTFAEWVRSDQLVAERPRDPAADAKEDEKLVAQSDDFKQYHHEFAVAARKLIGQGRCTESDFTEQGGWVKSVTEHANEPVYFAYCGGMTSANKVYLNVTTGQFL
jgi:hypothetical protein